MSLDLLTNERNGQEVGGGGRLSWSKDGFRKDRDDVKNSQSTILLPGRF